MSCSQKYLEGCYQVAIDNRELTSFDTLDIGFGEKAPDEPEYLAIFGVDTLADGLYGRQWVVAHRPVTWDVHSATGMIFQYLKGSSKRNSKFMTFYEAVSQFVPELTSKGVKIGQGG